MEHILVKGGGPILITAPHTIKTNRFYVNNTKIHEAENFIYQILMKLYKKLGRKRCTIMTWDKDKIEHIIPEDPNYTKNLDTSIWFKHLKKIKKQKTNCALHIDLHGMNNKSSYYDIEIGINALKKSNLKLYKKLKPIIMQEFDKLGIKYSLNGKFGGSGNKHNTITDKGILLGFNSIQLELEGDIRKRLVKDKKFFNKFTNILKNIHKELVPICSLKKKSLFKKKRTKRRRTKKGVRGCPPRTKRRRTKKGVRGCHPRTKKNNKI